MTKTKAILIVLNANISTDAIRTIVQFSSYDIVIYSSHRIGLSTVNLLRQLTCKNINYSAFSDILNEEILSDVDAIAVNLLTCFNNLDQIPAYRLANAVVYLKNYFALMHAQSLYDICEIYAASELGVCFKTYIDHFDGKVNQLGAARLESPVLNSCTINTAKLTKVAAKIKSKLLRKLKIVSTDSANYVFYPKAFKRVNTFIDTTAVRLFYVRQFSLRYFYIQMLHFFRVKKLFSCSTIHDSTQPDSSKPALVFQDGYLPSNYNKTYLATFDSSTIFCVVDTFALRWLTKFKLNVVNVVGFGRKKFPLTSTSQAKIRNILVVLNHAGDWSALVNRSDSLDLVNLIINVSKNLCRMNFKIRPHPTIGLCSHEGPHALTQIHSVIDEANYSNLKISSDNLSSDLQWSSIVITEYSDVLFEALALGLIVIIYKPSYRRSFMQDLINIGFPSFSSVESLLDILRRPSSLLAKEQDSAIIKLNQVLESRTASSAEGIVSR